MKKFSIILFITCFVGVLASVYGLCVVTRNSEQFYLLTYLFFLFFICNAIVLINYKEIDKIMSK
jgi:uncharacterized membrane protein YdjX (TVP38/TMEM64 family)